MRATILYNPKAGAGGVDEERLLELAAAAGLDAACFSAKSDALPEALRRPADLLVVAGGDGTVGDVVVQLPKGAPPLLILPQGTANNVARSLGIAGDAETLLAGWRAMRKRPLDLGRARGPWGKLRFIEGVGLGALAQAAGDVKASDVPAEEKIPRGRERLARVLDELAVFAPAARLDGASLPDGLLLLECLNIPYAGPSLQLARGDPGDGLLNVALADEERRAALQAWLRGEAPGAAPLAEHQGRRLTFVWRDVPLRIDDDFYDPPDEPAEVEVTLTPAAACVLVPEAR